MKKIFKMKKNGSFYALLILIALQVSCKSTDDITMFQDLRNQEYLQKRFSNTTPPKYRIKVYDNLYLSVLTPDPEINQIYNPNISGGSSGGSTDQLFGSQVGQYLNGYRVAENGTVQLPVIGDINIVGLTLEEAEKRIQEKAKEYLQNPTVQVKLLNFKVNVLGEVNAPGFLYNYEGNINIIEAIGHAQGITTNADLKNVVVNRKTNDITNTYKVDLTTNDVYASDVFYLQPNDVLYIPPTKLIRRNENVSTYSLFLSTLTSILLIFTIFD